MCRLVFIYWKNFAEASRLLHQLRRAWGFQKNGKQQIEICITLSSLHKLIKLHNLVKAGHKHDLLLAIFILYTVLTRARTLDVNKPT